MQQRRRKAKRGKFRVCCERIDTAEAELGVKISGGHQTIHLRREGGGVKERKKTRRLGEVEVMEQEGYGELEVDSKVEMIRALVPLGLMHVHELLDARSVSLRESDTFGNRRRCRDDVTGRIRAR